MELSIPSLGILMSSVRGGLGMVVRATFAGFKVRGKLSTGAFAFGNRIRGRPVLPYPDLICCILDASFKCGSPRLHAAPMSDSSQDAAIPFVADDHGRLTPFAPPSSSDSSESPTWYIGVPRLSDKSAYHDMPVTGPKEHFQIPVDEVVGEYTDSGVFYYYARFQGGIIHRVRSKVFPFGLYHIHVAFLD